MSKDRMSYAELMDLETRLRRAEVTGDQSLAGVAEKVRSHVAANPAPIRRQWSRRLSMFAVVGVPAAAAAVIGGIVMLGARPQSTVGPRPGASASPAASPQASPQPSPSPSGPQEALVAISLRTNPSSSGGDGGFLATGFAPDTVELLRPDGTLVSKATFKAAAVPLITNAATLLPPQAHVVGGAVYYIDGDGVVRRLGRDGQVSAVATFTTAEAQHIDSFAVSPDGSRVIATVLTFGPATGTGLPGPFTSGPSYDNLEIADAGGPARVLSHTELAASTGHFMVVGWDNSGPLAGTAVPLVKQNGVSEGWQSPVYHLDLAGNTTDRIGGPACVAIEESRSGPVLCGGSAFSGIPFDVRSLGGAQLWKPPIGAVNWDAATISPMGDRIAVRILSTPTGSNRIYEQSGRGLALPADFYAVSWFNEDTIVGYAGDYNRHSLTTISLAGGKVAATVTFPVNGFYVGVAGSG